MSSDTEAFIVTEKAMHNNPNVPDSKLRVCFRCRQPVGQPHSEDCLHIKRKYKVKMTVTYEVDYPASWTKDDVEFHRNEGSWCSDNAIDELTALSGDDDNCLCAGSDIEFECLAISTDKHLSE